MPKRRNDDDEPSTSGKRVKFTLPDVNIPEKPGFLFVRGDGQSGQLGLRRDIVRKTSFALVPLRYTIVDACAGGMHTVCLTKNGKVITFGCNDEGALGRSTAGQEASEFIPDFVDLPKKVIQISAGDCHTAALLEDGRVYAWGSFRDSEGSMGLSPSGNEVLPYLIISATKIIKIASGANHIAFLTNHGEILTCGCAEEGQLGRITKRKSSRHARGGSGKDHLADLLVPHLIHTKPRLKLRFENVWAGTYSTFAKVVGKDDIYVFGLNNYNQLGLNSLTPQYYPIVSPHFSAHKWISITGGPHHTLAVDEYGRTFVSGQKEGGKLGLEAAGEDVTELTEIPALSQETVINIGCGTANSFAVTDEGALYGWGMGQGQLGTGGEDNRNKPTIIKVDEKKVFRVSAGGEHTVILAV